MGVRVSFLQPVEPGAAPMSGAFVPESAIVQPAAAAGEVAAPVVFVVEDGRARRTEVTLGELSQAERRVSAGLSGGEVVVANPPAALADGDRVETRPVR